MRPRTQHTKSLLWLGVLLVSVVRVAGVTMALEVGEPAPDFTLPSTTGEQISLSQFQGKQPVLLEFYGADGSVLKVEMTILDNQSKGIAIDE